MGCYEEEVTSNYNYILQIASPARQKRSKLALGIMFGTIDESNAEANRLFENFFFSHIALFEGRLERLRLSVEQAYYSGRTHLFLDLMIHVRMYMSLQLSQSMRFPTVWHFDMCRLGRASAASFFSLETPNGVQSVA